MSTLHDSLKLILPRLPDWILSNASKASLAELSSNLPPVHYAGFEYRPGLPEKGLDLQQGINLNQRNRTLINRMDRTRPVTAKILQALFNRWSDSTRLQRGFRQIWLEFDHLQDLSVPPSLFLTLAPGIPRDELVLALQDLRGCLPVPLASDSQWQSLSRMLDRCDEEPQITHLGFMLSRPVSGIRVVRKMSNTLKLPLEDEELAPSAQRIEQLIRPVMTHFSSFRWCQAPGRRNGGTAEIECFFAESSQPESIATVLKWLLANGLCNEREHQVFESWPKILTPENLEGEWPQSLIFESLGRSAGEFSAIECKLGHIKLSAAVDEAITAKVYFGYLNRWLSISSEL